MFSLGFRDQILINPESRDSIWKNSIQSWSDTINFNSWNFKQLPESRRTYSYELIIHEAIKWTISYEPIVRTYSYEPVLTRFLKAVLEFDHDKLIMSNWGASEASLVSPNCPWMTSMENLPWLMGKFPLVSLWQSGKLYGQFSMACLMVHNLWASVQRWNPNLMSKWCQTLDFNMTLVNVTLVNMISTISLSLCSPLDQ